MRCSDAIVEAPPNRLALPQCRTIATDEPSLFKASDRLRRSTQPFNRKPGQSGPAHDGLAVHDDYSARNSPDHVSRRDHDGSRDVGRTLTSRLLYWQTIGNSCWNPTAIRMTDSAVEIEIIRKAYLDRSRRPMRRTLSHHSIASGPVSAHNDDHWQPPH